MLKALEEIPDFSRMLLVLQAWISLPVPISWLWSLKMYLKGVVTDAYKICCLHWWRENIDCPVITSETALWIWLEAGWLLLPCSLVDETSTRNENPQILHQCVVRSVSFCAFIWMKVRSDSFSVKLLLFWGKLQMKYWTYSQREAFTGLWDWLFGSACTGTGIGSLFLLLGRLLSFSGYFFTLIHTCKIAPKH